MAFLLTGNNCENFHRLASLSLAELRLHFNDLESTHGKPFALDQLRRLRLHALNNWAMLCKPLVPVCTHPPEFPCFKEEQRRERDEVWRMILSYTGPRP
jgi:hypothetical protein